MQIAAPFEAYFVNLWRKKRWVGTVSHEGTNFYLKKEKKYLFSLFYSHSQSLEHLAKAFFYGSLMYTLSPLKLRSADRWFEFWTLQLFRRM